MKADAGYRPLAPAGPVAPQIRNALLIIVDDLKASTLACYGDNITRSPHIDALAAQGTLFERALAPSVWCAPSRQSIMRSRYHGTTALPGPESFESFPSIGSHLRVAGFYTARSGKVFHMDVPRDQMDGNNGHDDAASWTERFNAMGREAQTPGAYEELSTGRQLGSLSNTLAAGHGQRVYSRQGPYGAHRFFVTVRTNATMAKEQADYVAASRAITLLARHRTKRFFLAVGFVRPHFPFVAPSAYFARYPPGAMPLPRVPAGDRHAKPPDSLWMGEDTSNAYHGLVKAGPLAQRKVWSGYRASVSFMDAQVGRVTHALKRLNLSETTVVALLADHGYRLGEHGLWMKHGMHDEVVRVPLIIAAPGLRHSQRCHRTVELIDVVPTLLDLLGISPLATMQGTSLRPLLHYGERHAKTARWRNATALTLFFNDSDSWRLVSALRSSHHAYIRYADGSEELYDMRYDPHQHINLVWRPRHVATLHKMRGALRVRLQAIGAEYIVAPLSGGGTSGNVRPFIRQPRRSGLIGWACSWVQRQVEVWNLPFRMRI